MDKLIQTKECSIIYGNFKGVPNQELFRCPRKLDDVDLHRYINDNRALVGFVDDEDTEDLGKVEGMELLDYWRMYYRDGWSGRWMGTTYGGYDVEKLTKLDCHGVNNIIDWLIDNFPHGCNYQMQDYLRENFKPWGVDEKRYLIKPIMSDHYKVLIDTTYGNSDYPVRVYVYKKSEGKEV